MPDLRGQYATGLVSDPDVEDINFSWLCTAGTNTLIRGRGIQSVTTSPTGVHTVQFKHPYPRQVISGTGTLDTASATGDKVQPDCGNYNKTTGQLIVRTVTAATTTVVNPATSRINVRLACQMRETNVQS